MGEPVVELSQVSRRFGAKEALSSVTLSLARGAVYGLVGANGAGKTTIIKHIMGLLKAQSGTVRVLGPRPDRAPRHPGRRHADDRGRRAHRALLLAPAGRG